MVDNTSLLAPCYELRLCYQHAVSLCARRAAPTRELRGAACEAGSQCSACQRSLGFPSAV